MTRKPKARWRTVVSIERLLDPAMIVLALVWLGLLIIELVTGLTPTLSLIGTIIWIIFIADFVLRLLIAPDRSLYLKRQWLTAISLVVPALRAFRIVRALRVLKLATSVNRGVRALGLALRQHGFAYVLAATLLVIIAGATGIWVFERGQPGGPASYSDALWWTAMIITTLGSDYWPQTTEGRVLCFLIALYALSVFGYITATIATYFLGDRARRSELMMLQKEIAGLREEIRREREG